MNLLIQFGIETQDEFDRLTILDGRTHWLVVASLVPVVHQKAERHRGTGMKLGWERGERRRMIKILADMEAFEPVYYFMMLVPDQLYQLLVITPKILHAYLTYNTLAKLLDVQHHVRYTTMCMNVNCTQISDNNKMEIFWKKMRTTNEAEGTWDKPFKVLLKYIV